MIVCGDLNIESTVFKKYFPLSSTFLKQTNPDIHHTYYRKKEGKY